MKNPLVLDSAEHLRARPSPFEVLGARAGKKHTDESLHLGRILSEKWSGGLSGGHKALAGGQIPFDVLLSTVPKDPEEAERVAVKAMTSQLEVLFQSEVI